MTCATCTNWTLLNRRNTDARAMARLHLVNCALGKPWEFLPAHQTCAKHQEADAETLARRGKWLRPAGEEPA